VDSTSGNAPGRLAIGISFEETARIDHERNGVSAEGEDPNGGRQLIGLRAAGLTERGGKIEPHQVGISGHAGRTPKKKGRGA